MGEKGVSIYELNAVIGEKVRKTENFRNELLSDPKAALEKEFKVKIPADLQVEVHVETSHILHIILQAVDTLEMNDDQLEQVAGGRATADSLNVCVAYGIPGAWKFPIPPDSDLFSGW